MSTMRYCGQLKIRVTYRDWKYGEVYNDGTPRNQNGTYDCYIVAPDGGHKRISVGAPAHLSHAVDSPEAFDKAAHAALSFADDEGFGVADYADMTDSGWDIRRSPPKNNPIALTSKTKALLGAGLLAGAGIAAYTLLSKTAAAAPQPTAIGVDPSMAGQTFYVTVGQSITASLPLQTGQSWQAVLTDPNNVLGTGTPVTQTTSSGESNTYMVAAPGTVQIGYQLYDASGNASGTPINFMFIAAPAA